MKKLISLILSICMLAGLFSNMNVLAAENTNEVMIAINDELSGFKKGDTISLSDDGYIGIPVDVSVYYDFEKFGKAVPGCNETVAVVYVVNTNTKRIGTASDSDIIKSMLDKGYAVAVADYKNNPLSVSPALEYSVQKIRTKLANGDFFGDKNVFGEGTYMENHAVPAGYNITLSDVYFELDKHGVNGDLEKFVEAWNYDFRHYWKDKTVKWIYEDGTRKATQKGFDGSTPVWYSDAACTVVDNENGQYIKVVHTYAKSIFDLVKPNGTPIDFNLYMHIIYPTNPGYDVPVMTLASSSEHLASSYAMENRPYLVGYTFNGYAVATFDFGYTPMAREDHYFHFNATLTNNDKCFQSASKELYQPAAMRYLRYLSLNNHEKYSFDINKFGVLGNSKGGFQTYLGHPMFAKHQYSTETENVDKEDLERLIEKKLLDFGANKGIAALDPEYPVTAAGDEGTQVVFPAGTRYSNGDTASETKHGMTVDGGTMQPWLTYTENGITKEISSGVQMVYSSCGGTPEYMCEGHSPIFSASNFYDSFGSGYTTHNYIANKMRSENIASLFFENALGHDMVSGKDMLYGVDTYDALFKFSDYYLKDTPVSVVYTSPASGDEGVKTTQDLMIKFYGPVSLEEINKVTIKDGDNNLVAGEWKSGYGDTEWTFTPELPLDGSSTYTVTVPADVKGDNGKEMGNAYTYSFGTADEEYIVTKLDKANATDKNAINIELEAPDLANSTMDDLKLRFNVTNDAANIAEIYSGNEIIGSINLKGKGYYEYDITDYIKNKTAGEKVSFSIKAKKTAGDKVTYKQDFVNAGKTYIDREGSAEYVSNVDGEAVTAVKLTNALHLWKNYGSVYYHTVKLTDSAFMNGGSAVTKADYGRKFKISVRYKDTASRYLNLSYNNCTDGNTYVFDYDYMMKSKKTTPGQWEEISVDYTSYEADYGVEEAIKTLKLEIPPVSNGEMPIYLDNITVTEYVTDIDVDGVYLVGTKAESSSFENKIPEEYKDKEQYPFVAFVGDRFVGAAAHYCDNDSDLTNDALGLARRHLLGETKADVTTTLYLRRDYDVTAANGDVWNGNYGQIGGTLEIDLGGHTLYGQIGLFNPQAKHGWDAGLGINSLYDSATVVKNGTIKNQQPVITHSIMAAGVDQYEHIRSTYFTFENVKFKPDASCNVNPIVSSASASDSVNHVNLYVTLNNCEIDLTNVNKAVTLFNVDDSADKQRANITMNGGRIISDTMEGITVAKLNTSGTDSFVMGKYEDSYPELILSLGGSVKEGFNTKDEGILYFIEDEKTESGTVYHLGMKPEYGTIPEAYQNAQTYPFAVFMDGEFIGAATHYADNNVNDLNSALDYAYKNLVGESKADVTLKILLRRDYKMSSTNGDTYFSNYGQLGGNIIFDLNGYHLNAQMGMFAVTVKHGWDSTLKINSLYDHSATVKNGKITIKDSLINHSIQTTGTDQYDHIRSTYFTFEDIKFELDASCSANPIISSAATSDSKKYANLYTTFNNCIFNVGGLSKAITVFNVNDSADKYNVHITINGGRIASDKLNSVTLASLNASGNDTLVMGKYEEEYPELVLSSGEPMTDGFDTSDGKVLYFTQFGSEGSNTVYRLGEKTDYGTIPAAYADVEKYPFLAFMDGKFIGAASYYSDNGGTDTNSVTGIIRTNLLGESKADKTVNVVLRRDYEMSTENGDTYCANYSQAAGKAIIDLNGYHLNAQKGMFAVTVKHGWDSTLKINSLYDHSATVKNGTITIKDSLINHSIQAAGTDPYEHIRSTYFTFEDIKFVLDENCSANPFISAVAASGSKKYANLYTTFENCEFDITGASKAITLFNANDSDDSYHVHTKINGGRIIDDNIGNVTFAALNASGTDSFVMGKFEGAYPELVLSSGAAPEAGFDTTDNGVSYFGKYEEADGVTVYRLGKKSGSAVIPYDKISEITGYNAETFTATVKTAEDGKYTLIFAQYDGDTLKKVDMVEYNFTKGVTANVVQEDNSFKLTAGDAIMLWRDMTGFAPVCEVYTVK